MFADAAQTASPCLRAATIAEIGAVWARASEMEKELLAMLPEALCAEVETPLIDAITVPLSEITRQLLALDAATDEELLIQARAAKHVRGTLA